MEQTEVLHEEQNSNNGIDSIGSDLDDLPLLQCGALLDDDDDCANEATNTTTDENENSIASNDKTTLQQQAKNKSRNSDTKNNNRYYRGTEKKPKWWRTIASQKGTKAQKASILRMLNNGYILTPQKFGSFYTPDQFLDIHEDDVNKTTTFDVWIEIGFGRGENILHQGIHESERQKQQIKTSNSDFDEKQQRKRVFLGAEIYQPGVGTLTNNMEKYMKSSSMSLLQDQNSNNENQSGVSVDCNDGDIPKENTNNPTNTNDKHNHSLPIRIYRGDGYKLLKSLPAASTTSTTTTKDDEKNSCYYNYKTIMVTFPDPFEKKSQEKWRIIQPFFIEQVERLFLSNISNDSNNNTYDVNNFSRKRNCGYFYLATDIQGFDIWTRGLFLKRQKEQKELSSSCVVWEEVIPCPSRTEWLPLISQYEQKGLNEGRQTYLQCWMLCY